MTKKDVLRKSLTFGADSLSIIAASILCVRIYHPNASFSADAVIILSFVPMLLITMALVSALLKTYQNPVTENVTSSMILSIGAFMLAFALSTIFLLLINSDRLQPVFLLNLLVYSVFFLSVFRLVLTLGHKKPVRRIGDYCIEELMGRGHVRCQEQSVSQYITDKTVFVAGGAGLIGFELCSQILRYNAKLVVLFDQNENRLYEAQTELSLRFPKTQFIACIGSIQDRARLREVFDRYRPQVVFHSAAYQHVTMLEANPQEALKNNVMGTLYMVEMAIKHRADRFILLSTDMAVNPTTIMGASKRIAEMLIQRANGWSGTHFSAVRFGTAIGSAGSIMQLFKKQIETGGPIFISDRNVEKYVMTIPQAASLILKTGALSKGGEIFTLGIGEPVNLYDLAKSMITNAGLRPGKDIKIVITGSQATEIRVTNSSQSEESASHTAGESIYMLKTNETPPVTFEAEFDKLCQSIDQRDYDLAFSEVSILVPTFQNVRL